MQPLTRAQDARELPADIVFTSRDDDLRSRLMRINAATLELSIFYQDDTADYLQPVGWSPSGQYLVVVRYPKRDYEVIDLCFVQTNGILKACFDHVSSDYLLGSYRVAMDFYSVLWSEDEVRVYFVKDLDCQLQLVEADLETGTIHQVLHKQNGGCDNAVPALYLSPSHQYLAIYSGGDGNLVTSEYIFTVYAREVMTVNLLTGDRYNLTAQMPSERGPVVFCPGWSPQGQFLSARFYTESERPGLYGTFPYRPEIVLVDPTGQITHALAADRLAEQDIDFVDCPAWDATETSFYFLAGGYDAEWTRTEWVSIFRYTLSNGELTEVGRLETFHQDEETYKFSVGPLVVSPDTTHVAFNYRSRQGTIGIGIFFPDGYVMQYEYSYPVGSPLWFPALSNDE